MIQFGDEESELHSFVQSMQKLQLSSVREAQEEKQLLRTHVDVPISSTSQSGKFNPNKTRIRWTQDLHEQFVEAVKIPGGAEKALRLQLDVQRLTYEQLEIQRNLQMRTECEGEKLQQMFEQQMNASTDLIEPHDLDMMFQEEVTLGV
ncbi:hypothetical protein J5N97_000021 [Dioscorea zingiberensis]|uniref:MYB-CC type transcription factor LHEQLE-containing domain-containing protein n=1 Tax=Dioscorea zingiberensis TaxID=325984 RepID=A0A9D5BVK7_9LILI|nr:hypothetical protein J5N97_000021 [Dioscorea zingiberensis]